MKAIQRILSTIDVSKMETSYVDLYGMCESEFEIYEYLEQPQDKNRLTYCYYHKWICTDTEVGIRVWYLDNNPVCISCQPYRKSEETFYWLSKEAFYTTRMYVETLRGEPVLKFDLADDEVLESTLKKFEEIDYKKFEIKNIIEISQYF